MIRIREMSEADRDSVARLRVTDEQTMFVDPIEETLNGSARQRENYVIETDGTVVGYFQIDSTSGIQTVPGSIALHEVQVDAAHQGKGLASALFASLNPFLTARYPDAETVSLTVNCRNRVAYRVYGRGGFVDTGTLYCGGRSGPQHVMTMRLR